jgi:hypothetical protein
MSDTLCTYPDRDDAIVTFLYDESGADADVARFAAHVRGCATCRREIEALRGVRTTLARWSPPESNIVLRSAEASRYGASPASRDLAGSRDSRSVWRAMREVPAWAQVAAAVLVLGVAAGIANLDVRFDRSGVTVHTGWSSSATQARAGVPGEASAAAPAQVTPAGTNSQLTGDAAPWRADLAALEQQLRGELRAGHAAAAAAPAHASSDAEILRRVRALVDESEKRQQRELALRVAEVFRDVNAQRQADLVRFDRAIGSVQNNLGVEVMKNRQQMNYFIRTSQRQQ